MIGRRVAAAAAMVVACLLSPVDAWAQLKAPSQFYWNYLNEYYDGAFRGSLGDFLGEAQQGSIKAGAVRWVDSICYHTMAGESYFQLGKNAPALDQYTIALNLFVQHADWMIRVQFEPSVAPSAAGNAVARVPWGVSKRTFAVGQYKEYTLSTQGSLNQMPVLQRGGVIQNPMLVPVCVQEVVRCTCQAIRRRRDILGPISAHDPLTTQVLEVCTRRQGQPNHWSECFIDLQLGMAFSAAGKDPQAKTALERSLVAGGQYDHPLTAMAMVELARIALAQADFVTAERWYDEATYAAVNFDDWGVLEDAFRYGLLTHLLANHKGMYPPLVVAADWARRNGLGYLQASLLQLCAENATAVGQTKAAVDFLAKAKTTIGRSDIAASRLGARVNYVTAIASYQGGSTSAGDTALAAAMLFQQGGSLWLFQIALVDSLLQNQASITPRVAMDLYTALLRDPTPADWLTEPIEALSVLSVPHPLSFESWFEVAISRKEYERALEIADLSRRHKFLSALEFGGRLLNLRWMLEGPEELLDQRAKLQKQDLLTRFVGYEQLAQQSRTLYDDIKAQPLWYEDTPGAKRQAERLAELAKICQKQETMLREIALRREPGDVIFPPIRTTKQVQETMVGGQALLAFFCTSRQTHAFLMTNDKYGYWVIPTPSVVEKETKTLLRDIGNWEQNKQLRAADLVDNVWKRAARDLLDLIMRESKISLPYTFTDLVIVPDNLLWYVPFEALETVDNQGLSPLISRVRLRYAPTVGLGIADRRPRRQGGNTAVVLGRLFPQDDPEVAMGAYHDLERSLVNPTAIHGHMHGPSGLIASLADRLIVLADIHPAENHPLDWSPIPIDRASPGSTLAAWMPLPWASPEVVILPGFHTSAESALKKNNAGNDLFMSITGLMATGARTVLISRWRPGGQSSIDLVREFAQELPHTTAADAWQRSVFLEWERELNPALEPRLVPAGIQAPPRGTHPLFWAAFLLADTGAPPKPTESEPVLPVPQPAAAAGAPANAGAANPNVAGATPMNPATPQPILGNANPDKR